MKLHLSLSCDDDDDEDYARGSWPPSVAEQHDEASSPPRTGGSSHLAHPPVVTEPNE